MISVNSDGTIARCYNGITNSSSGNCGFTINRFTAGGYGINFGFQINDRFISITPAYFAPQTSQVAVGIAGYKIQSANVVDVRTSIDGNHVDTEDCDFMIVIF
jgi:hypothetical protein